MQKTPLQNATPHLTPGDARRRRRGDRRIPRGWAAPVPGPPARAVGTPVRMDVADDYNVKDGQGGKAR